MTDNNVIDFPRIGFTLTPTATPDAVIPPPATTPDTPAAGSTGEGRRSPLDLLAALPDPGTLQPVITPSTPATPPAGNLPDTFRSEPPADLIGPRIGALSLAAILAVAVAALRGAHTMASTWWEQRQARIAETEPLRQARLKHQLAMQNIHDKAAQQRAKIPSSQDFGRKTLNRSGSGGGRGGGVGGGRGSSHRSSGHHSGTGPGRKNSPTNGQGSSPGGTNTKNRSNGRFLGGDSGSRKTRDHGKSTHGGGRDRAGHGPKPKTPKAPHRASQGGGAALKKTGGKQHGSRKDGGGRTTLADALKNDTHKAAQRRLKRRRNNDGTKPALWSDTSHTTKRNTKKNPTKQKPSTGPKTTGPDQEMWRKLKQAAARRWKKHRTRHQDAPQNPSRKQKTTGGHNTKQGNSKTRPNSRARTTDWWARARDYARKHGTTNGCFTGRRTHTGTGPTPGAHQSRGERRSPFENAARTTPTAWTVERADYPGAQAKRWEPAALTQAQPALPATGPAALDAAPTRHTARPGTTRPKEAIPMPPTVPARPDPRITKARRQAARAAHNTVSRHMDAQHETEITLDDALDEYDAFAADAFKTHDQCRKLSGRARALRDTLALFADDLATNHNLIGPLFSSAMVRMAEFMELVARMADEMEASSLEAAEQAETANNELNDAYRPISQATADAGLTTPSAPIHNQT